MVVQQLILTRQKCCVDSERAANSSSDVEVLVRNNSDDSYCVLPHYDGGDQVGDKESNLKVSLVLFHLLCLLDM